MRTLDKIRFRAAAGAVSVAGGAACPGLCTQVTAEDRIGIHRDRRERPAVRHASNCGPFVRSSHRRRDDSPVTRHFPLSDPVFSNRRRRRFEMLLSPCARNKNSNSNRRITALFRDPPGHVRRSHCLSPCLRDEARPPRRVANLGFAFARREFGASRGARFQIRTRPLPARIASRTVLKGLKGL